MISKLIGSVRKWHMERKLLRAWRSLSEEQRQRAAQAIAKAAQELSRRSMSAEEAARAVQELGRSYINAERSENQNLKREPQTRENDK